MLFASIVPCIYMVIYYDFITSTAQHSFNCGPLFCFGSFFPFFILLHIANIHSAGGVRSTESVTWRVWKTWNFYWKSRKGQRESTIHFRQMQYSHLGRSMCVLHFLFIKVCQMLGYYIIIRRLESSFFKHTLIAFTCIYSVFSPVWRTRIYYYYYRMQHFHKFPLLLLLANSYTLYVYAVLHSQIGVAILKGIYFCRPAVS